MTTTMTTHATSTPKSAWLRMASTNKGLLWSNVPYGDPGEPEKVEPPRDVVGTTDDDRHFGIS